MKQALLLLTIFCASLTACSPARQIVRFEQVPCVKPVAPQMPEYFPVLWHAAPCPTLHAPCYYLDADNAKRLLKNRALDIGYQRDVSAIFNEGK